MAVTRFANDNGAGVIIVNDPTPGVGVDYPLVRTGTVVGIADATPDGDDIINLNYFNWNVPDINGLYDYTVDQRVISKLPDHSGSAGSTILPQLLYTAPSDGVIRVYTAAGQGGFGGTFYINSQVVYSGGLDWEERGSIPISLRQGEELYQINSGGLFYSFLPNYWAALG